MDLLCEYTVNVLCNSEVDLLSDNVDWRCEYAMRNQLVGYFYVA